MQHVYYGSIVGDYAFDPAAWMAPETLHGAVRNPTNDQLRIKYRLSRARRDVKINAFSILASSSRYVYKTIATCTSEFNILHFHCFV